MKNSKILITDKFDENLIHNYKNKLNIDYHPQIGKEELKKTVCYYNILVISTRISICPGLIEHCKNLKLIIRMGAGVDHIDLDTCKKKKIIVCNTPNSNIASVSEYVFGQLLMCYRDFPHLHEKVRQGHFRDNLAFGGELFNKTIGIIGVGRIGSNIAGIAHAFGMNILGCDPYLSEKKRKKTPITHWLDYKEVIRQSDIVTLHVPLTEETKYMVNHDFLEQMKDNSILINAARGKVLKLDDLVEYADKGRIRKFIIDVFEKEPYQPHINGAAAQYFTFSPHAAAYTHESIAARSIEALEQIEEFLTGNKPHGKISYKKGY